MLNKMLVPIKSGKSRFAWKKIIFFILIILPLTIFSQVNTEKFRNFGNNMGFSGIVKLDASIQTGNTDLQQLSSEVHLNYKKDFNAYLLILEGGYGWNDGEQFSNGALAHFRYINGLTDKLKLEFYTQINYNKSRLLLIRALGGAGIRVELFTNEKSALWFGTSYMLEYERYEKPRKVIGLKKITAHRWSNYLTYTLAIKKDVSLASVVYFQPRFDLWSDMRILTENSLMVNLSDNFSLSVEFNLRYDSRPPETVKDIDTKTKIGFAYKL